MQWRARTLLWPQVLVLALSGLVGGCFNLGPGTVDQTRFYVLSPMEGAPPAGSPLVPYRIGVGPVTLPGHLERPQLVSRPGPNQVQLAELDQWAEPLADNIAQVVTENLALLLGTERVFAFPWGPGIEVDLQVVVNLVRFDATVGQGAQLVARWTLLRRTGSQRPPVRAVTRVTIPLAGDGTASQVAALNRAVERLCRGIAETVQTL